jgi:tetratricopeptide (TPR) repeat protein
LELGPILLEVAGVRDEFGVAVMHWNWKTVVNIFWLAVLTGVGVWLGIRSLKRTADAGVLVLKWLITALVLIFVFEEVVPGFKAGGEGAIFGLLEMLIVGIVMAVLWRDSIMEAIAKPFGALYDGGDQPPEPKPFYSIALSKRKLRRPLEAIFEIRKQLAQFPNDYEGVMLLATIQAEDTQDLPSAELTLNHFCDWEEAPPKQVAAALTQLADWHLHLAQDTDSARVVFERIIAKFPGTELAAAAAQRIARLEGTGKILLEAQDRRPMPVPEGVKSAGLRDSMADLVPVETDPEKLTAEYVQHLEQHPLDAGAREKLAVLYANHYKRLDLAAGELNQLIAMPEQPARRVAHWLNLLADLQIQGGAGYDTVRETLLRIVGRFPELPVAEQARSRLDHLNLELKAKRETPTKKLGVYEQNIGLKHGPTYGSKS